MPCDFSFSVALISLIKQCVTLVTVIKTTHGTYFVHETTSDHCFLNKTTFATLIKQVTLVSLIK